MVKDLDINTLYQMITADFAGAWDSLASNQDKTIGWGNFMFARQAMTLLEFWFRFCHDNVNALSDFSTALNHIQPKYFTKLPSVCAVPNHEFILPHLGNTTGDLLLWSLFDLIRHGLTHQYQQIIVTLIDNKRFFRVIWC